MTSLRRTYGQWAELKSRGVRDTEGAAEKPFQRDPHLEAFQYPQSDGDVHAHRLHSSTTGAIPLFMLSHFNCPSDDPRCKATVVFCASVWHYMLYRVYQAAQQHQYLRVRAQTAAAFAQLPLCVQLAWYAVLLFAFSLFSIVTMDCTMFVLKYVFYDSGVYLRRVLGMAATGARLAAASTAAPALRRPSAAVAAASNSSPGPKYTSAAHPTTPHFIAGAMNQAGTLNRTPYEFSDRFRHASVSG
ncbi:unnamed protein product [Notodromas monacha]|uniref:Uncharacterized protein n=1 Tax=Notodromas monacha TaxID=399045 RepID=A0A7R9BZ22_9CRUS|nr:unnamed protein product [Notodromas monacha]CAG0923090.1 unnamed protein product [Notodromas monacha]